MRKKTLQRGQSIVEVLIGLSIAAIVISAITVTVTSTLRNAEFTKEQNTATQHAQDGLEVLQEIRANDFATYNTYNGTYCLAANSTTLTAVSNCATPNVGIYIRKIQITKPSSLCENLARVIVTVSWTDSRCTDVANKYCHQSKLTSCFTDYNRVSAPS